MSSVSRPAEERLPLTSFTSIGVATLKASRAVDLDLYVLDDGGKWPTLYRGRDYAVSREDFERLEEKGVDTLYLLKEQHQRLQRETREKLKAILADDDVATTDRFAVLQFAVATEVENAFRRLNPDDAVSQSKEMGHHLTGLIRDGDAVPQQLFRVMQHDFNTFTHVINVSSYCVLLAQKCGYDAAAQLEEIAIGGMLHDIGKRHVPPAILNKPGRLTKEEFDVIREHPYAGYVELCERDDVTSAQLMMVYHHHEKIDGSGYPVGVTGSEMHPWARICAVVDVFDAITAERPYRKPMSMTEAFDHLNRIAGTHLDEEMVSCWTTAMHER